MKQLEFKFLQKPKLQIFDNISDLFKVVVCEELPPGQMFMVGTPKEAKDIFGFHDVQLSGMNNK